MALRRWLLTGDAAAAFIGGVASRELGYGWMGGAVFGVAFGLVYLTLDAAGKRWAWRR